MDDNPGGRFPGHIQNRFGSPPPLRVSFAAISSLSSDSDDYILQAPHFERRGDDRWGNRPTSQTRGTHPIIPQATVVNQRQFLEPPFPPAPYTNPVNNTGGFFHGAPQGLPNTSPPRCPPGNHLHHHLHTQPSPVLVGGHPSFDRGGNCNMGASRAFSPQAGSSDISPIQRRQSLPCPVSRCQSFLGRAQDQKRHLLTHLPHWIHCPAHDCFWRGDRLNAFGRHWSNAHPSSIRAPHEDEYRTYDPQPLMRAISEGNLNIQDAQRHAISMVRGRAVELSKPELSDNPWGSKCKRLKNSDLHGMGCQ
jgi:hypothetical protein